nr:hypothetical protein RVX_0525 [Nitratidesulfovibrio sp. HK-II]
MLLLGAFLPVKMCVAGDGCVVAPLQERDIFPPHCQDSRNSLAMPGQRHHACRMLVTTA